MPEHLDRRKNPRRKHGVRKAKLPVSGTGSQLYIRKPLRPMAPRATFAVYGAYEKCAGEGNGDGQTGYGRLMTSVGFIGLGIMGGPMAANLVKAGFEVVGYNRSRPKVDRLIEAGGSGAASAGEAIRNRDIIISVLPDSPDVEQLAFSDDGLFANARPGSSTST